MRKKILLFLFCFSFLTPSFAQKAKNQRIISLAPATTEILFALGLDLQIVGVTSLCDYPAQALKKEKIGTFSEPDIEKIISLKPDLILATGLEQALAVEKLKKLGLNVYVSDPYSMEELFFSIEEVGRLTGKFEQARTLVSLMRDKIKTIKAKVDIVPKEKRPKVFVEVWSKPLMTAGKGSFVDELIVLAGGENIAFDAPRPYSYFSAEKVIERDPDCIILGYMVKYGSRDSLKKRGGWDKIKAVKNGRVYGDIDASLFFRPGPRLTDGLEEIHNRLYSNE